MKQQGTHGQLTNARETRAFLLGGRATVTLVGKENRYTYRVAACADKAGLWFVSVMYGSDNESEYAYMGTLRTVDQGATVYQHGKKSKMSANDKRSLAFAWTWDNLERGGRMPPGAEVWHDGRCCRCGRLLTVPESIKRGVGPECASKMFFAEAV